jgi:hypothetical protein
MSWLFGFYAKHQFDVPNVSKYHPKAIDTYQNSYCYVAVGGNENLICYQNKEEQTKFFICGLGISCISRNILGRNEWEKLLNNSYENITEQDGHYCGIHISEKSVKLFTDQLGLREIHIVENNDGWFFSTRLDWLFQIQEFDIDFKVFSSRWLLFNQISNKSIIKNIERLNCGSTAVITKNKIEIKEFFWIPKKTNNLSIDQFKNNLRELILLGVKNRDKISLSLSGGLDSRVILSFLIESGYSNWDCYLFRTDSRMDTIIAKQILDQLEIPYLLYSDSTSNDSRILDNLFEYVGATYLTESAFTSQNYMHYANISKDGYLIDGGFGEIWRREFLTRLLITGKKALEQKNLNTISNTLRRTHADIFNNDISEEMNSGMLSQLSDILELLPDVGEIGIENWLDIFSIKTRLVNYYGTEQARIDNYLNSYMPFAQKSLLNDLLNVPVSLRKNNKLFHKLFSPDLNNLTKHKLAKGNLAYPFYMNSVMKRIYFLVYSKIAPKNNLNDLDVFLNKMKEFIMDSLESSSAKSYPYYDYKNIYGTISSYYKGDSRKGDYVNWFLTFEVFRQIMQKKMQPDYFNRIIFLTDEDSPIVSL